MTDPQYPRQNAIPSAGPITPNSRAIYAKMLKAMERYSSAKRTCDEYAPVQVTPLQVAQDLLARNDLCSESRVSYRSALLWHLRSRQDQSAGNRQAYQLLLENPSRVLRADRRKANRPKSIPEADLAVLLDQIAFMAERSRWAARTWMWLLGSLITGIRPVEWLHASWDDETHTALKVVTAKAKSAGPAFRRGGRAKARSALDASGVPAATAPTRTIPLEPGRDRKCAQAHMTAIEEAIPEGLSPEARRRAWDKYYDQCKQVVRRACKKAWRGKTTYSFRTMRKQFSANAKAAFGSARAAQLLGHCGPDSPSAGHYGKSVQAHGRFKGLRPAEYRRQEQVPTTSKPPGEGM